MKKSELLKKALRKKFEHLGEEGPWLAELAWPDASGLKVIERGDITFVEDRGIDSEGLRDGILDMIEETFEEVDNLMKFLASLELWEFGSDSNCEFIARQKPLGRERVFKGGELLEDMKGVRS